MQSEDKAHSSGLILNYHVFWCQTKHEIHSSPAIPNAKDKTQTLLYKLMIASRKFTNFGLFLCSFLDYLCLQLYLSHNKHATRDTWHVTHDTWHMRCDMWYVSRDTWHFAGGRTISQNFSSPAHTVCDLWYLEDLVEKADSSTDWIKHKGVCRTAPATPGLLKIKQN